MNSKKLLAILLSLLMLIPLVGAYSASALDPIIEKKGSSAFAGAHNSDKNAITEGDVSYLRVTPTKDAAAQAKQVNFDTVVKFTVSEGMYFKALVRTNVKGTPCVNFKIDGKFTGNTNADESLNGDGNWEEILVKVPGKSGEVTQMWCFLMGYDNVGSFASNAYIDVAGWGILIASPTPTAIRFTKRSPQAHLPYRPETIRRAKPEAAREQTPETAEQLLPPLLKNRLL